jgi:hypothetical protein
VCACSSQDRVGLILPYPRVLLAVEFVEAAADFEASRYDRSADKVAKALRAAQVIIGCDDWSISTGSSTCPSGIDSLLSEVVPKLAVDGLNVGRPWRCFGCGDLIMLLPSRESGSSLGRWICRVGCSFSAQHADSGQGGFRHVPYDRYRWLRSP